jgi:hypothetical protein
MADVADVKEKPVVGSSPEVNEEKYSEPSGPIERPAGWMWKSRKIGPLTIPWYASPRVQLGMVAFVCFLCPGMFNALSGLGGGGKADPGTADKMVRAIEVWTR